MIDPTDSDNEAAVTSNRYAAQALLDIGAERITKAETTARGFRIIADNMGERLARWAYADMGPGPHQRRLSPIAGVLASWTPTIDNWALVLSGTTGVGKTISAARWVAERGGMLLSAAHADRWPYGGGEPLAQAAAARTLLVDDLGDEKTPSGAGHLTALLADRERHGRITVVTTTLTWAAISKRGDHPASRLRAFFVELSDREDKRTSITPSLRGLAREMHLLDLLPPLRLLARTGSGADPERTIGEVAEWLKVDLESDEFHARVAEVHERTVVVMSMFTGLFT